MVHLLASTGKIAILNNLQLLLPSSKTYSNSKVSLVCKGWILLWIQFHEFFQRHLCKTLYFWNSKLNFCFQLGVLMKMALLLDNMEVYKGRKRTWLFRGHLHVLPCHTPSITMVQIAMQDPLITIYSIQNPLQVALTSKPKSNREWWTLLTFLDYYKKK